VTANLIGQVESIFGAAPIPAAVVGAEMRILFCNDALTRLLDTRRVPIGDHCYRVFRAVGSDGLPLCSESCRGVTEVLAGQSPAPRLMWCHINGAQPTLLEGTRLPLRDRAARHDPDGLCLYLFRPVEATAESRRIVALLQGLLQGTSGETCSASGSGPRPVNSPVSARETQILGLLHDGRGTGDIAAQLGIAPATVRNHVRNALRKLGAHSRLEGILTARREGWI